MNTGLNAFPKRRTLRAQQESGVARIGSLIEGPSVPQGCLPCNGGFYAKADYPELAKLLGAPKLSEAYHWKNCVNTNSGGNSDSHRSAFAGSTDRMRMATSGAITIIVSRSLISGVVTVAKSLTGLAWKPAAMIPGCSGKLLDVQYVNGRFFIFTALACFTSTDGEIWTKLNVSGAYQVAYGAGIYVFTLHSLMSQDGGYITSTDLATFTRRKMPSSWSASGVSFGNGYFVMVRAAALTTYRSTDGTSWSAGGALAQVASSHADNYGKSYFVNGYHIVPCNTTVAYAYTTDGASFTSSSLSHTSGQGVSHVSFDGTRYCFGRNDSGNLYSTSTSITGGSSSTITRADGNSPTADTASVWTGSRFILLMSAQSPWLSQIHVETSIRATQIPTNDAANTTILPTIFASGIMNTLGGKMSAAFKVNDPFAPTSNIMYVLVEDSTGYLAVIPRPGDSTRNYLTKSGGDHLHTIAAWRQANGSWYIFLVWYSSVTYASPRYIGLHFDGTDTHTTLPETSTSTTSDISFVSEEFACIFTGTGGLVASMDHTGAVQNSSVGPNRLVGINDRNNCTSYCIGQNGDVLLTFDNYYVGISSDYGRTFTQARLFPILTAGTLSLVTGVTPVAKIGNRYVTGSNASALSIFQGENPQMVNEQTLKMDSFSQNSFASYVIDDVVIITSSSAWHALKRSQTGDFVVFASYDAHQTTNAISAGCQLARVNLPDGSILLNHARQQQDSVRNYSALIPKTTGIANKFQMPNLWSSKGVASLVAEEI